MLELLLLLLPVAAASGWWAARRSVSKQERTAAREWSPQYLKGLNFLLNEQPDKAIDLLVKMVEVDSETVETHLALGNLFRRRGEVERAIRIHQNLIARPSLHGQQRAQALLELGQDYMRAGLFDRAENLFSELAESRFYKRQALSNLLEIFQQEKDWQRCLETAERLKVAGERGLSSRISHFHCELALQALAESDPGVALAQLKKAAARDRSNVRVTLIRADIAMHAGDCKAVIKSCKRVEGQEPAYLPEVLPMLQKCYQRLPQGESLLDYLQGLYSRHAGSELMLMLTDLIQNREGEQAAEAFVLKHLAAHPDLKGLDKLVTLNLRQTGAAGETLATLKQAVEQMLERQAAYQCEQCGFSAKKLHWQCPSCMSWGSIKPAQNGGVA